uniref:Zn(2)-C6 fungal-type domain-containing protein n=1 Tax=Ganoderma boninense TaxID=34458 RepID=A0A5K1JVW6_9APHY|nr:Zn(2)-C6 fungal-type domain-containing protein [Ganoderma boninense]
MHTSNSNVRPRMGGEQLTIMFEHCTDQRYYRGDSGSGSGRSSPSTSLPCTPVDLFPHSPLDVALAAEDSWNLIPYDVPWGPEYYHYRAGTLPGPEGACIFLRSPTPLKNRRTQKACNKCRQRKAKCSGSRPACSRCIARGYVCEYVEEEKRTAPQNAARARRQRAHSECSSEPAETADSLSDCDSSDYVQPKEEPGLSTPELSFAEPDMHAHAHSHSPVGYHPHHHDAHYGSLAAAYEYDGAVGDAYAGHEPAAALGEYYEHAAYADGPAAYFASAPVGVGAGSAAQMYHEATDPHGAAASVHAPRPVRCTGSPAFLTPEEHHQLGAFAAAADAHTHVHIHGHGHHAHHARGLQHHNDPMLISLAAADEAAPQMALPQVPLMPSPTDPALDAGAVEYAQQQQQQQQQQQEMYYYPGAGEPAMQFPYLQYQYAVQTYSPTAAGGQDELASGLYAMPMPMLPVGMMA